MNITFAPKDLVPSPSYITPADQRNTFGNAHSAKVTYAGISARIANLSTELGKVNIPPYADNCQLLKNLGSNNQANWEYVEAEFGIGPVGQMRCTFNRIDYLKNLPSVVDEKLRNEFKDRIQKVESYVCTAWEKASMDVKQLEADITAELLDQIETWISKQEKKPQENNIEIPPSKFKLAIENLIHLLSDDTSDLSNLPGVISDFRQKIQELVENIPRQSEEETRKKIQELENSIYHIEKFEA